MRCVHVGGCIKFSRCDMIDDCIDGPFKKIAKTPEASASTTDPLLHASIHLDPRIKEPLEVWYGLDEHGKLKIEIILRD